MEKCVFPMYFKYNIVMFERWQYWIIVIKNPFYSYITCKINYFVHTLSKISSVAWNYRCLFKEYHVWCSNYKTRRSAEFNNRSGNWGSWSRKYCSMRPMQTELANHHIKKKNVLYVKLKKCSSPKLNSYWMSSVVYSWNMKRPVWSPLRIM